MAMTTDFGTSAIAQSKLRIQKARREKLRDTLSQRRGITCLLDLVETSAKEVKTEFEMESYDTTTNPEESEKEISISMEIDTGKPKRKKGPPLKGKGCRPSKNLQLFAR